MNSKLHTIKSKKYKFSTKRLNAYKQKKKYKSWRKFNKESRKNLEEMELPIHL